MDIAYDSVGVFDSGALVALIIGITLFVVGLGLFFWALSQMVSTWSKARSPKYREWVFVTLCASCALILLGAISALPITSGLVDDENEARFLAAAQDAMRDTYDVTITQEGMNALTGRDTKGYTKRDGSSLTLQDFLNRPHELTEYGSALVELNDGELAQARLVYHDGEFLLVAVDAEVSELPRK